MEVYNDRLDRWETEKPQDLVDRVPHDATFQVLFQQAGKTQCDTVHWSWFKVRLPDTHAPLWILVADDETLNRQLVLIINIPLTQVSVVQQVYTDWRLRARIEQGYRFDQEHGWDVEDMRVQTVGRRRRLFAIVLLAAQRVLGLLQGISAVIVTCMTLSFVFLHSFPFQELTCG